MASAPSVEKVLERISHHNSDVLGCVAALDDDIYSNLPEIYDLIDVEAVVEYAINVFRLTDALETGQDPFDEIYLEFQSHSFMARQLDDGILILVNKPMQRGAFRKVQLGVNLFLKPLHKALLHAAGRADEVVPITQRPNSRLRRVFGNLV